MKLEDMLLYAVTNKLRFASVSGCALSLEEVWTLPLKSASGKGADLDDVACRANEALQKAEGKKVSFVSDSKNSAEVEKYTVSLELVKYIIEVKKAEAAKAKARRANSARIEQLRELLATKQALKDSSRTEEDILAELKALEG